MKRFPKASLILGGVASGKSDYAEALCALADRPKSYVATAQAFDAEMTAKITRHQERRGAGWTTIEAPFCLETGLGSVPPDHVILVDCLTLWLSNLLLREDIVAPPSQTLVDLIATQEQPIVFVSNEVGLSGVPENALARRFQKLQGQLNRDLAACVDLVVLVTAGLPQVLKGQLPTGVK